MTEQLAVLRQAERGVERRLRTLVVAAEHGVAIGVRRDAATVEAEAIQERADDLARAQVQLAGAGGHDDGHAERCDEQAMWQRVSDIPDSQLWAVRQLMKRKLMGFIRERARTGWINGHLQSSQVIARGTLLDPEALTLGFARRFATYKRATLLFRDLDRLKRLLQNHWRPVQLVFAGKAHPADRPGQGVIQDIFGRSRSPKLRGRVFIMEDYDIRIGRYLVQGVDVWLNNPRRPLEASGTSGMKAAMNGVINCSVLDGWWDEGWTGDNGWAIGGREMNPDEAAQDWADAQALYGLLEQEIVPRWYDRDASGLPRRWIQTMRRSMGSSVWRFSTARMLEEYVERMYLPASFIGVVFLALLMAPPLLRLFGTS